MQSRTGWNTLAFVAPATWDEEGDAAAVVQSRLGGVIEPRDPGGGAEQLHDFDLVLGDGRRIAFEVTRENVQAHHERRGAVDRLDWHFPELSHAWDVGMIATYDVRETHGRVGRLLADCEEARVDAQIIRLDDQELSDALVALHELGARRIVRLWAADDERGGEVLMGETGSGGVTAPSTVIEVAERLASEADNAKKLRTASAGERHLFVWIERSQDQALAAMYGWLPEVAPVLPAYVDAVWLAAALQPARIWRYRRAGGWWEHLGAWTRTTDEGN